MVCDGEWNVPEELDAGYAATFSRLRGLYRSRGLAAEDAADLAQEAIARALLHLRRHGCNGEPVTPLVNRIAANLLVDHLRSGRARTVPLEDHEIVLDAATDPSEEVARRHVTHEVRAAIASLPDRHQRAIALSLDGRTPAEIATDMGIRRNAADALLFRARRGLAEVLRAAGATLGAAIILTAMRARRGARRLIDEFPNAIAAAHGSIQFVSVALVTGLAAGAPAASIPLVPSRPVAAISIHAGAPASSDGAAAPSLMQNAGADAPRRGRWIEAKERRVRVSAPTPGIRGDWVGLAAWVEQDAADPGITGTTIDHLATTACAMGSGPCATLGGTP